ACELHMILELVERTGSRSFFFFFQAEDGIRDRNVTGVQTCALPISVFRLEGGLEGEPQEVDVRVHLLVRNLKGASFLRRDDRLRSEGRRVGKECRSRGVTDH